MSSMPEPDADACPFRVGDRIIEKQNNAEPKRVTAIFPGSHICCAGLNRTRISWRNLKRYRPVTPR